MNKEIATCDPVPVDGLANEDPRRKLTLEDRSRISRFLRANKPAFISSWYGSQFDGQRLRHYGVGGVEDQERTSIERFFISPLLDLLSEYARTGDGRYSAVYQDERLRYCPHQAAPAVRTAFFGEVIPRDEAAILERASGDTDLQEALTAFLTGIHAPLLEVVEGDAVRLLAVGDCLMNEVRVFLPRRSRKAGVNLDMCVLYFSATMGRSISTEQVHKFIEAKAADLLAFSFLTYEGLPLYPALLREANQLTAVQLQERVTSLVGAVRGFLNDVRERTDAPFLVHNASGLPLARWRKHLPFLAPVSRAHKCVLDLLNHSIREMVEHTPNAILLDECSVAAMRGHRNCAADLIPRRIAGDAMFHTTSFGDYLAEPYEQVIRAYRDLKKAKVLVIDFDNTLWSGVMADGPVQQHHDRQELLRRLKDAGILLVGVSKNDSANVRWDEMRLQPDDFALLKISWNLKAQSIEETAQQLDLGLDSFVFIDDNPAERDLVRTQVPQVRTMDACESYTWQALRWMLSFPNTRETPESRERTAMYRAQAQRREAVSRAFDYPAMMASLQMEVRFGLASRQDLDRLCELIRRTNQFNTTTIRYNRQRLASLLESAVHRVYVADLSDKFGKLGLVIAAIVERKGSEAVFDSFVMSCRAMGFGLEQLMVGLVLDAESSAVRFIGRFIPTDRNTPASALFSEAGFAQTDETRWALDATAPRPEKPQWFKVVERPGRSA